MSLVSMIIRRHCKKADKIRDAMLVEPTNIVKYKNIKYGKYKDNVLDVYTPLNLTKPSPVIISVHGGAWVYGDKEIYRYYCMDLVKHGFSVVNFTYRLSPRYKFPCYLEDTVNVFNWLYENYEKYNLDINNVFVVGDSAGAHILSLFISILTKPELNNHYKFNLKYNYKFNAIGLNCGIYDMVKSISEMDGANAIMRTTMGHVCKKDELEFISPITHVNNGYPPIFLMTSNKDFLLEQNQLFLKVIEENNIEHKFKCYGDDKLECFHCFHLDLNNSYGQQCNEDQCNFFKEYINK